MLEADLQYFEKLNDLHNDYLLSPEKIELKKNMISSHCKKIRNKYISVG